MVSATLSGSPSGWTGTFTGLEKNKVHAARVGATDNQGRTYAFDFSFDTIFHWIILPLRLKTSTSTEGPFFDTPEPCNIPGGNEANCYFDRVATPGVDANDTVDDDRPTDEDADYLAFLDNGYRFGAGAFRDELVDTWASGDASGEKYVTAGEGIQDFDVERVQTGEWYNYTRTLPSGTTRCCSEHEPEPHRAWRWDRYRILPEPTRRSVSWGNSRSVLLAAPIASSP